MISFAERAALTALSFDPAPTPDDVWRPSRFNVPELHENVVAEILAGVNKARREATSTPLGVAMQGRAGSGKTHLLGAVRERIQLESGYFFLVNLLNPGKFWESTALSIVEGLGQRETAWGTQLKAYLRRLTSQIGGVPVEVRDSLAGDAPLERAQLDEFIRRLRVFNAEVGRGCQDTARALVLLGAQEFEAQDVGYAFLISEPGDPERRAAWGIGPTVREPELVVRDISRLMALTLSPTVIAIDQIDTLFAQTSASMIDRDAGVDEQQALAFGPVADGLLRLRDITRRTLVVVSCLPDVWALLTRSTPGPVMDRFRAAWLPERITTPEIGRAIIEKRFSAMYAERGFQPSYGTWPVRHQAFVDAVDFTPRALLRRVEEHVRWCLGQDEVVEMDALVPASGESSTVGDTSSTGVTFSRDATPPAGFTPAVGVLDPPAGVLEPAAGVLEPPVGVVEPLAPATEPAMAITEPLPLVVPGPGRPQPAEVSAADLAALDERFEELVASAKVDAALDPRHEDVYMPRLLAAALTAWISEQGPAGAAYKLDPPQPALAALHGRLVKVLDEATENEEHWGFRAIASTNAIAVISRVRAACTASGLDPRLPQRRLVVLRRDPWPSGPRTKEVTGEFAAGGGVRHEISDQDLKVFAALCELSADPPAHYREWLVTRRPASYTGLFRRVLGEPPPAPAAPEIPVADEIPQTEEVVPTTQAVPAT